MFEAKSLGSVLSSTKQFKQLGTDDQISLLWCIYTETESSIVPIVQEKARLQLAKAPIDQIKQLPHAEQLQVMRDLVNQVNTPISRSYGVLSVNTKLSFWHVLVDLMQQQIKCPISDHLQISTAAKHVLAAIKKLNCSQQITFLRNAVVDMGVDSLAS
ncbi:MAG: Orange carotenoid protein [Pseudanabaena sp. RU_4_16]|nr:Orange carotenoid protein [Pseudanabaena sp. RU_4_16]